MPTKHPLLNNPKWRFSQPEVGFRTHCVIVGPEEEKKVKRVGLENSCREGLINDTRSIFQTSLTNLEEHRASALPGPAKKPKVDWQVIKSVELVDPACREEPTYLKLRWHKVYMQGWEDFPVNRFLKVCDVVMGPLMVLLSIHRPLGEDWWKSADNQEAGKRSDYVHWNGSDNWFLSHPVAVAIATGLYRQCFHLCGAGLADEIIETVSDAEIAETLSANSQRLALQIIKRTRPFIEVPSGYAGTAENYPFSLGFWRRLMRFQRAIRRVGYEGTFGESFAEGWKLASGQGEWKGVYNFWGGEDSLTDKHRHLMKAGEPRRRKREEEASSRAT